jgi:hypothetical protein
MPKITLDIPSSIHAVLLSEAMRTGGTESSITIAALSEHFETRFILCFSSPLRERSLQEFTPVQSAGKAS